MKPFLLSCVAWMLAVPCFGQALYELLALEPRGAGFNCLTETNFFVNENFDGTGTPSGWGASGAGIDFDYATAPAPLAGTHSLRLWNANDLPNIVSYEWDEAVGEAFLKMLFMPQGSVTPGLTNLIQFLDSGLNIRFSISWVSGGAVRIISGGTTAVTADAMLVDTAYYIWGHYKKGTGSDSIADAWFNETDAVPTSVNRRAAITGGNATADVNQHYIASTNDCLVDNFQLHTNGCNYVPFWNSNNLTLWLVADDLTGLADNTQVAHWTNRMVNHQGFTNDVAGVIKSNAVVNGHAAVFFDGVGNLKSVETTNWADFVSAEAATIFVVMRQRSADDQNAVLSWVESATEQVAVFATYGDTLYFDLPDTTGTGRISGAQPGGWDNVWHVLEVVRGSDTAEIMVDGIVVATGTPTANLTSSGTGTYWKLGSISSAILAGDIAEVRVFSTAKSAGERASVRANLKAIYNTL